MKYYINNKNYNYLYYLYIRVLLGKLIKKGKRFKALKIYKNLKRNIKLNTNKEHSVLFILLLSMLKSKQKVSFKEIYLGSQKKELPMPVEERKQVLNCVETLLKFSKNGKKLELNKMVEYITLSYRNRGGLIRHKKLKYEKAMANRMLLNILKPKKIYKQPFTNKYNVSKKSNYKIYKNKASL
jgi:ribosomal protein S7